MDFFRGWFNYEQRDNDIGPSGLPRFVQVNSITISVAIILKPVN